MIHQNELSFKFGNYLVAFSFDRNEILDFDDDSYDEDFFSFNSISDFESIENLLVQDIQFKSCTLKGYEYLGLREDMKIARSISNEMFYFIKKIKALNPEIIDNYFWNIDYGDSMCDSDGSYVFGIKIKSSYWLDLNVTKLIVELIISINVHVPEFYTIFFRKNKKIDDNRITPIVSTNTKVRRLGYFKILSDFLDSYSKIPYIFINNKFEDYCLKYESSLNDNTFTRGLISKTSNGISAKPYIEIALSLNILNKINNIVHTGKSFKVYQVLQKQYSVDSNIFKLSEFDKIFFLECILKNDYFYFTNLLELFFFEENTTYKFILEKYQSQLISCLEEYKKQNVYMDRKNFNNIDTVLKRINNWEKPEVYLEHILMPRINWMLDFGILVESGKGFAITEIGMKLFKHLSIWNDINTDKIISPVSFIERFMLHMYDDCFRNNEIQNPKDKNFIVEKIYKYIDESFNIFKTLAPNRVTASQSANYTKYKLYLNENIKVGYQFILDSLSEQDRFIFKYQEQYQDGYIQKKHHNG